MRRLLALAALVIVAFSAAGCRSTWDFWKQDVQNTVSVWRRDFNSAHQTFDRFFLNYDWDDPYL